MDPQQPSVPEAPQPIVPPPVQTKYAGFWIRFVASYIDSFVLLGLTIVLSILEFPLPKEFFLYKIALSFFLPFIYFVYMTTVYGATLGKMAVGIKVVSEDGMPLNVGKVLLREVVGKIISGIILYIGFIMAAFTARKQGLHDKIASTLVVYKDPNAKLSPLVKVLIVILVLLYFLTILGIIAAVVLGSLSAARMKARLQMTPESATSTSSLQQDSYAITEKTDPSGAMIYTLPLCTMRVTIKHPQTDPVISDTNDTEIVKTDGFEAKCQMASLYDGMDIQQVLNIDGPGPGVKVDKNVFHMFDQSTLSIIPDIYKAQAAHQAAGEKIGFSTGGWFYTFYFWDISQAQDQNDYAVSLIQFE